MSQISNTMYVVCTDIVDKKILPIAASMKKDFNKAINVVFGLKQNLKAFRV